MINAITKKVKTITLIFLCFIGQTGDAQNKLDAYFNHLQSNNKMMGSVAISLNDSIVYKKAIGYSNADAKTSNTTDTKFRVGSITKTYTAVLALKAVEEELLTLDTKLSHYYPEVKNAEKITIEHLLKQRTGIYNFTEITGEVEWGQQFHTQQEFINYFVNQKSNFEPGSEYEYSNTNYALLGFILEKIYGKTYAEILDEKIVRPLHLHNTYYSFETDETKNEALSYNIQDKYVRNEKTNFSNHPASGGIVSTPTELNKFLFALFNGKLITPESLKIMLPEEKGAYGMGIIKLSFKNPEGYTHSGRVENYISDYYYFPDENIGIVSLTNAVNINTDEVMNTMLMYLYRKTPELANFNATAEVSEKDFMPIKGTYYLKETHATVTISSDGQNVIFQDSRAGQMYVPLTYKAKNEFEYEDLKLSFVPKKKEMIFEQGGVKVVYKKK